MGMLQPKSLKRRHARGTEEFWVPAVLAAVSAGTQYANQSNATQRENAATVSSIQNQEKLQSQGNQQVNQLTKSLSTSNPDQLAAQATGQYVANLRKNATGSSTGAPGNPSGSVLFGAPTSALPTDINASNRYQTQAAGNQQQIEQFGNTLAGQMGQIDAATRQRQNEGLQMQTLGTNLNLLGAQSYTQAFADRLRASAAGVQSPWLNLLAGAAAGGAKGLSNNMAPTTTPALVSSQYSGGYAPTDGNSVDVISG